jgi:hypothetical protein
MIVTTTIMSENAQLLFVFSQVALMMLTIYFIPKNEQLAIKALLCQTAVAILLLIWITL